MSLTLSASPFCRRRRRRTTAWSVALLLLSVVLAAPASAQVVISELMADPASDWDADGIYNYRDDEWVEVLNTGTETVDLSAYYLRDGTGDDAHLNLSGDLAAGEVAVFFGSDAVAWQQAFGSGSGGLSLNNGGDTVVLMRATEGGEPSELVFEIIDSVTYLAHEAEDDRASGLSPDQVTWLLFDALNPYTGDQEPIGTGCGPSPGVINTCDPLPVDRVSFGNLKALYH